MAEISWECLACCHFAGCEWRVTIHNESGASNRCLVMRRHIEADLERREDEKH
jgi:hypothetical protein